MAEAIGYPAPRVTSGDGHERRGLYQNTWRVGAVEAPCRLPLGFCAAVLCAPCVAFHQRCVARLWLAEWDGRAQRDAAR